MKIIVIVPAYNEAQKIYRVVRSAIDIGHDVLVIDDGSSDVTAIEAERAGAKVLRHMINRGYGAALTTGNGWALRHGYDTAVHFDADGQHNPEDIDRLVAPIVAGKAEVALGSRFISRNALWRVPAMRRILIKLAVLFTWFVSGIRLTDAHNGLRAFSSSALKKMDCRQDGMSYASEIVDQINEHNLRYEEVGVTVKYTDYSMAKGENNLKKVLLGLRFIWEKMVK